MRKLLNLIVRFHFFILFVLFEVVSLKMVISSDHTKRKAFFSSANAVSGFISTNINNLNSYFELSQQNNQLVKENHRLINELESLKHALNQDTFKTDTSSAYNFAYLNAKVIKNTVSKSRNFITIDKGDKDGVEKDFAVIGIDGIVGVVVATSKHYSLVVSILNERIGISAKLKNQNFFGTVHWEGDSYRYAKLSGIPNHLTLSEGDTIVSSGFSSIFPANIPIGVISKFTKNGSTNFFDIDLRLITDMKSIENVYVVNNKNMREQILLEKIAEDEY